MDNSSSSSSPIQLNPMMVFEVRVVSVLNRRIKGSLLLTITTVRQG